LSQHATNKDKKKEVRYASCWDFLRKFAYEIYETKTVFRYKATSDLFGKVHRGVIKILRSTTPHAQISKVRGPQPSSMSFVPFRNKKYSGLYFLPNALWMVYFT